MWGRDDISVIAVDSNANGAAEKVMERLKARKLPVNRGVSGRYLVVCCRAVDTAVYTRLHSWAMSGVERIILLTETAPTQKSAWDALRQGASDVVHVSDIEGIADRLERWLQIDELMAAPMVTGTLIGETPAWTRALRELIDLARFSEINLLLGGESGTGKELAARLVHTLDARPEKGELVTVDCTTIVPTLSGSELFGHEKGAFTGADRPREGALARANGGTLFLDEIGELSLPLQAELLRVIQEGSFKPVGSDRWRKTAFRLVCATHWDLSAAVLNGTFRQDLYFRIASAVIRLPPLRERAPDIPQLAAHFLDTMRPGCAGFDPLVLDYLAARKWPGNVRELRQFVQRVAARHCGNGVVTLGALPREDFAGAAPSGPRAMGTDLRNTEPTNPAQVSGDLERVVREMLTEGIRLPEIAQRVSDLAVDLVVQDEEGNLQRAATRLGVTDRALQQRRHRRGSPAENTRPPGRPPRLTPARGAPLRPSALRSPARRAAAQRAEEDSGDASTEAIIAASRGVVTGDGDVSAGPRAPVIVARRRTSLVGSDEPGPQEFGGRSVAPRYGAAPPETSVHTVPPRMWGPEEDFLGPENRAGLSTLPPMPDALRQSLTGKR